MNLRSQEAAPSETGATWTSSTTLADIAARLRAAERIVLLTHSRPDGDAIGSTLSIARALAHAGKAATPYYTGPWAHRFDPVVAPTHIERIGSAEQLPSGRKDPDAILVADTGSWQQLMEVRPWLTPRRDRVLLIDHHLHGDADVAALRFIDTRAAAASQPAAEVCRLVLNASSPADLPVDVATPLYMGLATDTGWFRHPNVTPEVMILASQLLTAGVDHAALYEHIEQSDRPARLRLMARALASLQMHARASVAVMSLTRQDFQECGGELEDAGGLSEFALSVASVRACAVLTELTSGVIKVSLRSKRTRNEEDEFVDVNAVAMSLGGGGHAQASGAKLHMTMDEARAKIVEALTRRPQP